MRLIGTEPDAFITLMLPADKDTPFSIVLEGRNMSDTVAVSYLKTKSSGMKSLITQFYSSGGPFCMLI